MKLVQAIATERPRRVNTRYGEKYVIDCLNRENGETFSLWRPATDSYTEKYIIKNSPLTVGIDGKGRYSLIEDPNLISLGQPLPVERVQPEPVHTYTIPPQSDPNFSPDKKAEMAEYVANLAQLYQHCQDKAENIALTPDDARAIGTTLFIQTVKHFNL